MKYVPLGNSNLSVPAIGIGCMRMNRLNVKQADRFVRSCIEWGATYFDHADMYKGGECERLFGQILQNHSDLRDNIFLQSKCGIDLRSDKIYNFSKSYIISCVEGSLQRLQTDHLDMLLLHRPDALVEPEEVAEAFEELYTSGKVLHFGVSNHSPGQIELLKKYLSHPLLVNQLQLSIPMAQMIVSGMEVNRLSEGAINRDGDVLNYCRINDVTIQAWSPFQGPDKKCFLGNPAFEELNQVLEDLAKEHHVTSAAVAAAWILRHPAKMQVVSGSMDLDHTKQILAATSFTLNRQEWYQIYKAAGYILP